MENQYIILFELSCVYESFMDPCLAPLGPNVEMGNPQGYITDTRVLGEGQ